MSQITTHILDTSDGMPATGVAVTLEHQSGNDWLNIGNAVTDDDGRIKNFIQEGETFTSGVYRLIFDTRSYYTSKKTKTFYPKVTIEFVIFDDSHYHVPLLLNPYGYTTYRGS